MRKRSDSGEPVIQSAPSAAGRRSDVHGPFGQPPDGALISAALDRAAESSPLVVRPALDERGMAMLTRVVRVSLLGLLLLSACGRDDRSVRDKPERRASAAASPAATAPAAVPPAVGADPQIAAAGDIACDASSSRANANSPAACHQAATAELLVERTLAAVLTLGDSQYDRGALSAYAESYDLSWGRLKAITHPAPGNHEYETRRATGYFDYFGAAAGDPDRGYYSYEIGGWHLIALNSNCGEVGGCDTGSAQERWLRADLAAHPAACTLAYWHHPRFSSGPHGSDAAYDAFWRDLTAAGADLVLNGHDHNYERFAPQDAAGQADPSNGIREFVVGTGGKDHYPLVKLKPNSEARNATTFGVLLLTLHAASYDWQFLPEPGATFADSGSGDCHGRRG